MIRNGRLLTIVLGMAVLMLLAAAPASAQCPGPAVTYTFHNPVSQTLYNFCAANGSLGYATYPLSETDPIPSNADPMALVGLSGEYFFEQNFQQKPNGDCHVHWTSHYTVSGTNNGIKYVGKDQQNYDLKLDPDGTGAPSSDFRTSDKFKLIAQGPTPDLSMTQKLHVTVKVDKQGNVTTTVKQDGNPVFKCQGAPH